MDEMDSDDIVFFASFKYEHEHTSTSELHAKQVTKHQSIPRDVSQRREISDSICLSQRHSKISPFSPERIEQPIDPIYKGIIPYESCEHSSKSLLSISDEDNTQIEIIPPIEK
ncbi:hypothetical protein ADUPG1_008922 [Aduncisulcus paluster]|uniref:Uncharacterized protein n=1 Tax=Aduncisulcus paluster TaxID=2918883 RepID=A0ABQ5KTR6_9EUKA|nr:hypothetical protein ADUPG1_008922 [Aduncisulcus paluster]